MAAVALSDLDAAFAARGGQPTAEWPPALRGVWHALRGDWHKAHDAVQPEDADCAWVHAALHHDEGDLPNADYWYRLAGRLRPAAAGRVEYEAIAHQLLGGTCGRNPRLPRR